MTAVGLEPTPLRNGALSHRLSPNRFCGAHWLAGDMRQFSKAKSFEDVARGQHACGLVRACEIRGRLRVNSAGAAANCELTARTMRNHMHIPKRNWKRIVAQAAPITLSYKEASRKFEARSLDSKSRLLTVTLRGRMPAAYFHTAVSIRFRGP